MIAIFLILMILGSSYPSYKNAISTIAWGRLSSITLIFSALLIMNILYISRIETGLSLFSGFFKLNIINQSIEIIMLIIAGLILIPLIKLNNNNDIIKKSWIDNYFLIILFNIIGACCLITSNDLLSLYVSIELQSFSLYILSTLNKDSINSASAGLKYFLIGSLASAFILLGIAFFYLLTGLTNFESLYIFLNITDYFSSSALMTHFTNYNLWNFDLYNINSSLIIIAFLFIIIGAFIKIGAAPFHQWTPDVYDQVPTKVTIWLVIIPKLSIFILLLGILDLVIGTGNSSTLTSIASLVTDGLSGWSGLIGLTWDNYFFLSDYVMHLFLFKFIDNFGHANFFNINNDFVGWMNYYRTEIPYDYFFLPVNMGKYIYSYHNTIFLNYFIPTIQEVLIKNVLVTISIISLIIGSVVGLYQIKIKRLLAFSAVSQIGFLILALAINTKSGLESFIFYLPQYSIVNLNIFLILIAFSYLLLSSPFLLNQAKSLTKIKNNISIPDIEYIIQLKGLFNINPILTLSFIISLFSLMGIPPLPGFFAKMQVLSSALSIGLIFVSIIAILTSVLSAYYYLVLINKTIIIDKLNNKFNLSSSSITSSVFSFYSDNNHNNYLLETNLEINLSIIWSYIISILTLSFLLFIVKSNVLFNIVSVITDYSYYI